MATDSIVRGHNLVRLSKQQKKAVEVIHRSSCRLVRGRECVPWIWAEGVPVSDWPEWFRPCRVCCPDVDDPTASA